MGGSRLSCLARRQNPRREALRLLRLGRCSRASELYREARRRPIEGEPAQLALEEADALAGLGNHSGALERVTRALRRRPRDGDLVARLRIQRAWCLWLLGRTAQARREIERVDVVVATQLTRARLLEVQGWMAWKEQHIAQSQQHLDEARSLYEHSDCAEGLVRVLEVEGAMLRDAGRLEEALDVHARRIAMASRTQRLDSVARSRADRGAVLTVLGRWSEARDELTRSAALFREIGDRREITLAGVLGAVVDLALGSPEAAQAAIERALDLERAPGSSPRLLAEDLLLLADTSLALGRPLDAQDACVQAQQIFASVGDRGGECWAHLRRSQALLEMGSEADAERAVARASALLSGEKVHVAAWVEMAQGRIRLRKGERATAAQCFERALELSGTRPGLGAMARLGLALALGESSASLAVKAAFRDLEAWGDRRLNALCARDVALILGEEGRGEETEAPAPRVLADRDAEGAVLVDAALSLQAGEGWAGALSALHPSTPWHRAVWAGGRALGITSQSGAARPLDAGDIALQLCRRADRPSWFDLGDSPLREHPSVVALGLVGAAVAPLSDGSVLYADFVEECPSPDRAVGLLAQVGRLIAGPGGPPDDGGAPLDGDKTDLAIDHGIVGSSPAMRRVLQDVARVGPTRLAVLISGETGTGKELVARAIHGCSDRAQGPFVAVNAASLEDPLVESLMFGHARGSFTGADRTHEGFVARADGGTLFLDEVADLSPRAQAKLLRFLEDREYFRLGETTARRADVRIVSAANADLDERMREGRFRADLYYRLRGVTITLPPLRQRGDDVLEIARHMLRKLAREKGRPTPPLPAEIARALQQHSWPGNVRQLALEVERALSFAGDGPLRCEFLSPEVLDACGPEARSDLRQARRECEGRLIAETLDAHGGNRTRAARALGLSRQGLGLKMRQVGLA